MIYAANILSSCTLDEEWYYANSLIMLKSDKFHQNFIFFTVELLAIPVSALIWLFPMEDPKERKGHMSLIELLFKKKENARTTLSCKLRSMFEPES